MDAGKALPLLKRLKLAQTLTRFPHAGGRRQLSGKSESAPNGRNGAQSGRDHYVDLVLCAPHPFRPKPG